MLYSLGGDHFDICHEKCRLEPRTCDALIDAHVCYADLVYQVTVRRDYRMFGLTSQHIHRARCLIILCVLDQRKLETSNGIRGGDDWFATTSVLVESARCNDRMSKLPLLFLPRNAGATSATAWTGKRPLRALRQRVQWTHN